MRLSRACAAIVFRPRVRAAARRGLSATGCGLVRGWGAQRAIAVSSVWLLGFLLTAIAALGQAPAAPWPSRPYRALVVVERWSDPASVRSEERRVGKEC